MPARAVSSPLPLALLVRTNRQRLHLTQGELAERVGVSRSAISELEAGRIEQPRAAVFARLGKALGLPAAALLAAAGYPAEGEFVLGLESDEIALLAASLAQLAGTEREWLRTRLLELRDLLVLRGAKPASAAPARAARRGGGARRHRS
ncbi:MAG TPA: helix-turn-helix transcriptional regulator [Candidatus Limnocylindria bacterium]|jgi:transcriptional regulator with XRE-family HTH domain|nr:helix-turn-helix transcriptional regulator [Candidatus Limnocylindria bacterium]